MIQVMRVSGQAWWIAEAAGSAWMTSPIEPGLMKRRFSGL
jgi:hypothetical protein